ncbi:MAG: hypothetical protein WB696_02885 [Chthoniobacterales bacterium]
MVNHYYWYGLDRDFGPFFLKFCSYFPYNAKLCLNGHEYAQCQLRQQAIPYQALDNGFVSCADPQRLQTICDQLGLEPIDALLRRWLARLPHPYTPQARQAGDRYDLSILQAEFSLTQILDRPLSGRIFFEEIIRENLDLGRPDQVQLLFQRRVTKKTPGRHPLPAYRLQKLPYQAVLQTSSRSSRSRCPHRDHHQPYSRFFHRQAAV